VREPPATAIVPCNGQPGRRLPVFIGLCLVLATVFSLPAIARALDGAGLQELVQLARAGAPQLALRRMDAEQPAADQDLVQWTAWEQERLQILASQGLDASLIDRVKRLPAGVDARFHRQALSLKADAQLRTGQAQDARATVRTLLWSHATEADKRSLARWRRLVVRSYLLEAKIEDARLALLRYRQDFGNEDPQWRWLSARVMLQGGHADSAVRLLQQDETPQGRFLRYAAQLKASPQQAAEVEKLALGQAQQAATPQLQSAFWGLAARAAGQAGQPRRQIEYLEHALALPFDQELMHGVLVLDADQLWDAWLQQGKRIGNREQKLLGNDEDWYFPATEAVEKDPLRARVLFAVLSEFGSDVRHRSLAHEYLVGMLDDLPGAKRLVRRLYLESRHFADVDRLPPVIRYRLIDEALEAGELNTASRLMDGLAEPPAGADRFAWNLRRARVAIFTGKVDAGVKILEQQLAAPAADRAPENTDRLLQVVFDLQTLQAHRQALQLFTALLDKPLEPQQRRELLFWMADSLQALEQYEQAAYLYLKSATLTDVTAMDPWAQTARYHAAQALVEAGLLEDARQIYTSLLHATRDASRKAVLQNEIQRLYLVAGVKQKGS